MEGVSVFMIRPPLCRNFYNGIYISWNLWSGIFVLKYMPLKFYPVIYFFYVGVLFLNLY